MPETQKPSTQSRSPTQLRRAHCPVRHSKVEGQVAEVLQLVATQRLLVQVVPEAHGLLGPQPCTQSVSPEQPH